MIVRAGIVLFIVYLLTAFVTNPYELLGLRLMQGLLSGFIPGLSPWSEPTRQKNASGSRCP